MLPVRLFAEKPFLELLSEYGFELVLRKYYHYENHHTVEEDNESNRNADGKGARDILYIMQKKPPEKLDVNLCYQYSFSYFKEDVIDEIHIKLAVLEENIRKLFPASVFETDPAAEESQFFKDINTARGFLHGNGLPFQTYRVLFPEYSLSMPEANVFDSNVFMTIFPEISIAQVNVSLKLGDCEPDFLVYMRHVFSNGRKLENADGRKLSVNDIYMQLIGALGDDITDVSQTYLLEINKYGDLDTADKVFREHPCELYGMICGDEGYRRVPHDLAVIRLSNSWGSRTFTRFSSFGENMLLVNLNRNTDAIKSREERRNFDNAYYNSEINPYFLINSNVAGINHGVIFSWELAMAAKTIANRILSRQSNYYNKKHLRISEDIRRTKRFRGELITTLKKIENLSISEVGELEHVIIKGQQIESLISKIKYLLELLESELELLYQNNTNRMVNILTTVGLLLTAVGIIAGFIH